MTNFRNFRICTLHYNIDMVIKSRKMKMQQAKGHRKCKQDFGWESQTKRHLANLIVDGRMILKWVLKK